MGLLPKDGRGSSYYHKGDERQNMDGADSENSYSMYSKQRDEDTYENSRIKTIA